VDIEACLGSVEAALADGDADLSTDLGDHHEVTSARLWRNQVLVDWERDPQAGGCLLRPDLLRRLVALHARVERTADGVRVSAPGRIVASLSADHADLVARLGGARRVEMHATLRFEAEVYRGGQETYYLLERGQRLALLRLTADVRPRPVVEASRHTSPAPM
jgi:hypothetical protein